MRTRPRAIWAIVLVLAAAWLFSSWLQTGVRRLLLLTSADPGTLGLVASGSLKSVKVGLRTTRERLSPAEVDHLNHRSHNVVDQRLSFTLPAAYVTVVDLNQGPGGPQRLGFTFWSVTLDPSMPDHLEYSRHCGTASEAACPENPFKRRREAAEVEVRVEVTNSIGTDADRRWMIAARSGLDRRGGYKPDRPCDVGYDPVHDLVTLDKPADVQRYHDACDFGSEGTLRHDGLRAVPRNFAKRDADGGLRYSVRCDAFSPIREAGSLCELQGYFGVWPFFMWVHPSRIGEWDDLYTRVTRFLVQHVAHRTDAGATASGPD